MSRSYISNWQSEGSSADPDLIYYNASIINNTTDDSLDGNAVLDPPVKFNETRAQPIIRDASQYQFSIMRFVINGANKDLPLFIPSIQSSTGQTDVDLTEYGLGISIAIPLPTGSTQPIANLAPPLTYIRWTPEVKNTILAPKPLPPCAPTFVGNWAIGSAYSKGAIVFQDDTYFQALQNVPPLAPLPEIEITDNEYWAVVSSELGRPQDVSTRYYWLDTFQHWVSLVNLALVEANTRLYNAYDAERQRTGNQPSPYTGFSTGATPWTTAFPTPVCSYDIPSGLFSINYPDVYRTAQPIFANTYTDPPTPPAPNTQPTLWFNQNLEGLLSNFYNIYYNTPQGDGSLSGGTPSTFPGGYVYKMLVQGADFVPDIVRMTQEAISTSTLWSPIESLVFISNLLPIQNEQVAPPNTYGSGNIGNSSATAPSAFQPIITDVANDLSLDPFAYRKMIYYAPTAEYRMSDFKNSKQEIKSIDIQVFWKNRLNNNLYPLTMYNLSSVSIKILFRKKTEKSFNERITAY
jgi:hypothetical protein